MAQEILASKWLTLVKSSADIPCIIEQNGELVTVSKLNEYSSTICATIDRFGAEFGACVGLAVRPGVVESATIIALMKIGRPWVPISAMSISDYVLASDTIRRLQSLIRIIICDEAVEPHMQQLVSMGDFFVILVIHRDGSLLRHHGDLIKLPQYRPADLSHLSRDVLYVMRTSGKKQFHFLRNDIATCVRRRIDWRGAQVRSRSCFDNVIATELAVEVNTLFPDYISHRSKKPFGVR
jgi:hypothetical protein